MRDRGCGMRGAGYGIGDSGYEVRDAGLEMWIEMMQELNVDLIEVVCNIMAFSVRCEISPLIG